MRGVAGRAAFDLYDFMFVDEGPLLIGMTFEAHQILRSSSANLARQVAAVRIVTVGALHQAFVDAMVERAVELLLFV